MKIRRRFAVGGAFVVSVVLVALHLLRVWYSPAFSQESSGAAPAAGSNLNIQSVYANGNFAGATNTVNWNNGQTQTATLTGNTTLSFTNPVNGANYCLSLTEDGTGGRTVTWPTTVKPGPIELSAFNINKNANQTNTLCFAYDGTNYRLIAKDSNSGQAWYDLYTDGSNYSRLLLNGNAGGAWKFSTEKAGTGVAHDLYFQTGDFAGIHLGTNARNDDIKIDAGGFVNITTGPVLLPTSTFTTLGGGALYQILNNSSVPSAIASTNTETFFALGGAGGKLPYSALVGNCGSINCAQARFEIETAGIYGINGVTDSLRVRWYLCQTSAACAGTKVLIADTGVVTPAVAGFSNQGWNARIGCNVFTAGVSGTIDCQGLPGAVFFTALTTSILDDVFNTGTATADTTQDEYLVPSVLWNNSSASNTITLRNLSIKVY